MPGRGSRRLPTVHSDREDVRELTDRTRDAVNAVRQGSRDRWDITSVKDSAYGAKMWEYVRCNPSGGALTVTLPVIRKATR